MRTLFLSCTAALFLLSAFETRKKAKLRLPDEFVRVPAGSYYAATEAEDPYYHGQSKKIQPRDSSKIRSINGFYISKYEVSNLQYRSFFNETVPGLASEEIKKIICDSSGWNNRPLAYGEPMVLHYYNHPAYNNYPVVNITYAGAVKYCEWLQQKIQKDNPGFTIEVKLPSKEQWIWAAQGGRSQAMYPWGNFYLRNRKGEFLCNFKRIGDQAITRNRQTGKPEVHEQNTGITGGLNDRIFYTAPVKSFYPNDFGLYNMCGNAAEMITEKGKAMGGSWNDYGGDVHIRSEAEYNGTAPTIGFRPIIIVKEKLKNNSGR